MDIKKRLVFIYIVAFLSFAAFPQAALQEDISKLKAKVDTLGKAIAKQDSCLREYSVRIAQENKKVVDHDTVIEEIKTRLHRQYGTPAIGDSGFVIGVGATIVLQATNNPNAVSAGGKRVGDASFSTDLTFQKNISNLGSKAFLHCEAGAGKGLDEDLQLFSYVNFDALGKQAVQIAEAWYEQTWISGKAVGTIGLMDPTAYFDGNNAANDETVQFLSQIFVVNPTIEYPSVVPGGYYAPGILLKLAPYEWLEVLGGAFDVDQDWRHIGDNLFNIGQISISANILGFSGTYRLYGWNNQMPHTNWLDSAKTNESSYGLGFSFDQKIGENATPFVRYGWRSAGDYDPQAVQAGLYSTYIGQSWSIGVQFEGKLWRRENDAAGLAFGQMLPSADYKTSNPELHASVESHVEAYWRIQVFENMSISPDIQYIINPFGKDAEFNEKNIPVLGVRSQVDF